MRKQIINICIIVVLVMGYPLAVLAADTSGGTPSSDPSAASSSTGTTPAPAPAADSQPAAQPPQSNSDSSSSSPPAAAPAPTAAPAAATGTSSTAGSTPPTGPDAGTYSYNSQTGLWENAYYIWDPVTHQTKPKTPPTYSYNPATGKWDTTQWVFDAGAQKYVPNVVSVDQVPATIAVAAITGPSSSNTVNSSQNNNGIFNLFYDASISNKITSLAASGNASVTGNTLAGSALSGNALDVNNIMNMLQSTWNLQPAANLLTFTANINGNVTGDLTIDPNMIAQTGQLSANNSLTQSQTNLTVNAKGSGLINNDISVGANSGNATLANNTSAGNAGSGSATAVANVVNVLNSAIAAGQSFLGVININGNLNGDILLPPNFLDQLIASGAPQSTIDVSQSQTNNVVADLSKTQTINNNVNLAAVSGKADVGNNTSAGNATSGSASTKLTIFNLTGRQVVGNNSLLVFVNVLGKWVGLIMDAPPGSTTAQLCGGSCQSTSVVNNNVNLKASLANTINNNLAVNSKSGDASVNSNTRAGNARSGNASASANLLNISGSNLSFKDWFGILFINVLGTWNGSFGVNTDAGNSPLAAVASAGSSNANGNLAPPNVAVAKVFRFIPRSSGGFAVAPLNSVSSGAGHSHTGNQQKQAVLSASTQDPPSTGSSNAVGASSSKAKAWLIPAAAGAVVALTLFAVDFIPEISDKVRLAILSRKFGN
ncbi:MAG: hypothetical protein JWO96_357 [Candidatus Saccharibacteria bacterium]|nr:hypothetical protein [Candidatus Saccharibacteria bacterium]